MKTTSLAADAALIDSGPAFTSPTRSRLADLGGRMLRSLAGTSAVHELATLDDRMLRDIGMSDADIGRTRAASQTLPFVWS